MSIHEGNDDLMKQSEDQTLPTCGLSMLEHE